MWEHTGQQFEVGDFVFAKFRGHPHWPATISQIETLYAHSAPGQEKTRYNVYFYGTHQMSMIKVDSIVSFNENYERFKRKYASSTKFTLALLELEADKATREDYVKSLQIADSIRQNELQEKTDDMFNSSDRSTDGAIISCDRDSYGSAGSRFRDIFESDEEYQSLNHRYEVLSLEKVPLKEGSSDFFFVISLGFNERDLQEDYQDIREELRMMTCFVKVDPSIQLPSEVQDRFNNKNENAMFEEVVAPLKPFPRKRRKRNRWRTKNLNFKPSLTILAAEAVKKRRQRRKTFLRDETRHLSLRRRYPDATLSGNVPESTKCSSCSLEKCTCASVVAQHPSVITCPICQAQFTSSVDYKQHSFNIHIMGL